MIERIQVSQIFRRIEKEDRRFIQVLYGPRQVGKTTAMIQFTRKTRLPWLMVSADGVAAADTQWIAQQWEVARLKVKRDNPGAFVLIIDEIQKVANWSEQVKKEWDQDSKDQVPIKVVLLGSSRLMLQQGLTESLAGRFETLYMGHWSYEEMQSAFDFTAEEYVWYGGYPGAAILTDDELRWKQYISDALIDASINRDILFLTRIDKPALLRRLFELGCTWSGQILSFNKILGQLQDAGNTTTLSHYLRLLDGAGLLTGLEKYSHGMIRRRASIPKFQVQNTALMSAQHHERYDSVRQQPELWGRWVESAVGAHLINCSHGGDFEIYYWREKNDEVDFVLARGPKVAGLEVKSGTSKAKVGASAFAKRFKAKVWQIGSAGIPWADFLRMDPAVLLEDA